MKFSGVSHAEIAPRNTGPLRRGFFMLSCLNAQFLRVFRKKSLRGSPSDFGWILLSWSLVVESNIKLSETVIRVSSQKLMHCINRKFGEFCPKEIAEWNNFRHRITTSSQALLCIWLFSGFTPPPPRFWIWFFTKLSSEIRRQLMVDERVISQI